MSKLFRHLVLLLIVVIMSGCASTAPEYSIGAGKKAILENDFIGTFNGKGIVKKANGAISTSFTAKMIGYKEDGVIFLREIYSYENAGTTQFTYRISPAINTLSYDCVRIENLNSCEVTQSGGTISIEMTRTTRDGVTVKLINSKHLFHFLDNKLLIKQTYFNKFLFMHDATEIVHYTRTN